MLDLTFFAQAAARRRKWRLDRQDPLAAQQQTLRALLISAQGTRFGRAHGFAGMRTVADYQRAVPLRRYEDFWREWWQPAFPVLDDVSWPGRIPFFAESSGTTAGVSKFIPVSWAMVHANQAAAADSLFFHLNTAPGSRLFGGENFLLGGSTDLRELAPGVRAGDLSGIVAVTMPAAARLRSFPPVSLALIPDWDRKLDVLAMASLHRDIRSIAGTPSWMLLLFQRLAALHPDRPASLAPIFPNLEMIVHGGVGFGPYRDIFAQWLAGTRAVTREVYAASEGYVAAADLGPDDGMRLMLDHGLFFEFVPPEDVGGAAPRRYWLGDADIGVDYALAVTSNAGLFSYVIGDLVRLVSKSPPRLLFSGRLGHELSLFGEHLTGAELDAAVTAAARGQGGGVSDFCAASRAPTRDEPRGQHVFVVEFVGEGPDAGAFAAALDAALRAGNADYAAHRAGDVQLLAPAVRFVPVGSFSAWMRRRGRLGGQNKVPRVVALEELERVGGGT